MDKLLDTLSARLKYARKAKHLSQDEVAAKLNKTTSAYGHYERGRNEMSREVAQELAKILDVNFQWLLTGEGPIKDEDNEFLDIMKKVDKNLQEDIKSFTLKLLLLNKNGE